MATLREHHADAGATTAVYGPPEAGVELVESFGPIELEYAAISKGAGLIDLPSRAVVEATGDDRLDFLDRMLTQKLKGFEPGRVAHAFWLNKTGRIDADIRVVHLPDRTLLDTDVHSAGTLVETLGSFLFSEDCELEHHPDVHRLALHGPTAGALLAAFGVPGLGDKEAATFEIAGAQTVVARDDSAGVPGFELCVAEQDAVALYESLLERGGAPDRDEENLPVDHLGHEVKLRPIGWHAYNVARIEAGSPAYFLDFGPGSIPNESGVLHDRVSFDKGCYLGQEIVARIASRGHPKQRLVALRCDGPAPRAEDGQPRQPLGGAQVFKADDIGGDVIGAVTSSTLSPMLGAEPICFAMVRDAVSEPGTKLGVHADGEPMTMVVLEALRFVD